MESCRSVLSRRTAAITLLGVRQSQCSTVLSAASPTVSDAARFHFHSFCKIPDKCTRSHRACISHTASKCQANYNTAQSDQNAAVSHRVFGAGRAFLLLSRYSNRRNLSRTGYQSRVLPAQSHTHITVLLPFFVVSFTRCKIHWSTGSKSDSS